jgi:hypothetical protein
MPVIRVDVLPVAASQRQASSNERRPSIRRQCVLRTRRGLITQRVGKHPASETPIEYEWGGEVTGLPGPGTHICEFWVQRFRNVML